MQKGTARGRYPDWATTDAIKKVIRDARIAGVAISKKDFTPKGNLRKAAKARIYSTGTSTSSTKKKKSKSKKRITYAMIVSDHSGSMSGPKADEAKKGINSYIEECQAQPYSDNIYIGHVAFGDTAKVRSAVKKCKSVKPIGLYPTPGMTALRDGIALGIKELLKNIPEQKRKEYQVVLLAFTDGLENYSRTSSKELKTLIQRVRSKYGWMITLSGSGGAISAFAADHGIDSSNTLIVEDSAEGFASMSAERSASFAETTASYMATGTTKEFGFFVEK